MKLIVLVVAVLAVTVTQGKYLMTPYELSEFTETNEIGDGIVQKAMITEKLYIPMASYMICTNNECQSICHALGYKHGMCISTNTCKCYN